MLFLFQAQSKRFEPGIYEGCRWSGISEEQNCNADILWTGRRHFHHSFSDSIIQFTFIESLTCLAIMCEGNYIICVFEQYPWQ